VTSEQLRVLHLRGSCGLYGAERVILDLARHQPALGIQPVVVDFRRPGDEEGPFLRAAAEQATRALPLPCRGRLDLAAVRRLRQLTVQEKIDVFHGHDYKANFYGFLALRNLPVPLVATNHGHDRRGLKLAFYQSVDSYLLRLMDAIIAVAEPVAEAMRRHGVPGDRIAVIRNGLDLQSFVAPSLSAEQKRHLLAELGVPGGRRVIGSVGRLELQKGYDLLLAACARLLPEAPDLHLVIVGDGSLRDALTSQASRLGVADHVTFTGAWTDVTSLLRLFSIFVSSSRSEGMPMAVLEAAALELPIVATAVGDTPHLIEDGLTGRLVPPGEVSTLAQAMREMLADPEGAGAFGRAARGRVETRFSAYQAAIRTADVYGRALGRLRGTAKKRALPARTRQ